MQQKVEKEDENTKLKSQNESLLESEIRNEPIILSNKDKNVVKYGGIIYLEASGNSVKIFVKDNDKIKWLKDGRNLSFFEDSLPENLFLRIQRSYIINMDYIVSKTANSVTMLGSDIPFSISRGLKENINATLKSKRLK